MIADIVFKNGEVITVDQNNSISEAAAVKGNRIVGVGTNTEISSFIGENTKVIDLQGRSMLPGFIDSHVHMMLQGANKLSVNCKESHLKSMQNILDDLKAKAEVTPKGQWLRAIGFDETEIVEKRYPTKSELDEVSKEHPVIVMRTCLHTSIVNSKALEIAGVTKDTPNPVGGIIGRDEDGLPNGVLYETAHMEMFEKAKLTREETIQALGLANNEFISLGITSIHDAGGYGPETLRMMQEAVKAGHIKVRIYTKICALHKSEEFIAKVMDSGVVTGLGNEKIRIGPVKIFVDGSSSVPTIATREPYTSNPQDYGILFYTQEEIDNILNTAHEHGFQITAHAQGDRAIEMLLNTYEKLLKKKPKEDHRFTIEHAGLSMPDLLERMKQLKVIPIPNPAFPYFFGDGYIKNYGARVKHIYPLRDILDHGLIAAAGSDTPVASCNPLMGIHVAANRISKTGQEVGANQRISVMEAIRLYTWNGAYVSFEEDIKGSIEAGKLADLVVLDKSILKTDSQQINELKVALTMIDGDVVYLNNNLLTI
ncbi:MAG: amidohydrolase [Bacillota bacterium]